MKNRLAQSIQHYLYKGFPPAVHGNGENAGQNGEDDCAKPFDNESPREMNKEAIFKRADPPPTTAPESSGPLPGDKSDGTVSRAFLNRLMDVFMESAGPVAPWIVRHHIGLLGESEDAFPKSRVDELIKSIEAEILHPEIRMQFEKKIAEEIRNFENQ